MSVTTQFGYVGGQTRYGYFDDFLGAAINPVFGGVSTNSGTAAIVAGVQDGVVGLITGATSTNYSLLSTGLNYKASVGGPLVMEAGVCPHTSAANMQIFVGFTDTVGGESPFTISGTTLTSNATDAVGLLWSTAATNTANWYFVSVNTDADGAVTLTTQAAPIVEVFQSVRVQIDQDGTAYAFCNGVQVGKTNMSSSPGQTGRTSAVSTSVLLTPIVAAATLTSSAKTAYVDYMYVQSGRKL